MTWNANYLTFLLFLCWLSFFRLHQGHVQNEWIAIDFITPFLVSSSLLLCFSLLIVHVILYCSSSDSKQKQFFQNRIQVNSSKMRALKLHVLETQKVWLETLHLTTTLSKYFTLVDRDDEF